MTFTEKSNGRLPLFALITFHENRTEVVITLPEGFTPAELELDSRGGFVHIGSTAFSLKAKTYTGNIYLEPDTGTGQAGIMASTSTGIIREAGKEVGTKTSNGTEYEISAQDGTSIELETSRGSIFINE